MAKTTSPDPPAAPPAPVLTPSVARRFPCVFALLAAFLLFSPSAEAQVVQLPTLRNFGIGTTIVVPDRGTAWLGGVRYGAWGTTRRGTPLLGTLPGIGRPFRQEASGGSVGESQVSVQATILDLETLDRETLAEGRRQRELSEKERASRAGIERVPEAQRRRAAFLDRSMGRSSPDNR